MTAYGADRGEAERLRRDYLEPIERPTGDECPICGERDGHVEHCVWSEHSQARRRAEQR